MRKCWLLAVLAVALSATAPAHAGWKIDRATRIAAIVWHDPCEGSIRLRWGPLPVERAEEKWFVAAYDDCAITFDAGQPWPWPKFCTTMLHEYGHAAGMPHSDNPLSVMYPEAGPDVLILVTTRTGSDRWKPAWDPRCRARGRPFLSRYTK